MDELFTIRALTRAVNQLKAPLRRVLDTVFARKRREITDQFQIDIVAGSETILPNLAVDAPAVVGTRTTEKTFTVAAPRLAEKRFLPAAYLNSLRAMGQAMATQTLAEKLNRELTDMRNKIDRTREHYAAGCLAGKILDADGSTLVDWNLPAEHLVTLEAGDLWSAEGGDPLTDIRTWKRMIEDAAGNVVNRWVAFCGYEAMDALILKAKDYLVYTAGRQLAEEGRIARLAEVDILEYNGSYLDSAGVRQRFVAEDHFKLVGLTSEDFEEYFAPVVDLDAPGGVGAGQPADLFFSKSWRKKDASGVWIKVEARPLPVVHDTRCFIDADVV